MKLFFVLSSSALLAAACAQVLGIEDAELDPQLVADALCNEYCNVALANCTGEHAVYTSPETCRGVCAALPAGDPGATIGNNVHCRLENARAAASTGEPENHCPAAGPGGDGVCGDNCEGYCLVLERACPGEFDRFNGQQDCVAQCEANVPDLGGFDVSQRSGDTMQCRLYHVSAASDKPDPHCSHAIGDVLCVPSTGGAGGS